MAVKYHREILVVDSVRVAKEWHTSISQEVSHYAQNIKWKFKHGIQKLLTPLPKSLKNHEKREE